MACAPAAKRVPRTPPFPPPPPGIDSKRPRSELSGPGGFREEYVDALAVHVHESFWQAMIAYSRSLACLA